jgi:hypothetical protein
VSQAEKCCYSFSSCYLQLINVVDFLTGATFIVFSIYLWSKLGDNFGDATVAWVGWATMLVGAMLVLLSVLTFLAMSCVQCLCMFTPSDVLIILINLLCLVLGVLSIELQPLFSRSLRDHGASWGLTATDIRDIDNWYWFIAFGFFAILGLQTTRFVCNRYFKKTARRLDTEYDSLLQQDNQQWDQQFAAHTSETEQKYRDLRSYYKMKYQRPSSHEDLTRLEQHM